MRTARELHQTLARPPLPSSKRTTTTHGADDGGPAGGRRSMLQSGAGRPSRRSTTAHGAAAVGLGLEGGSLSLPPTAGGTPRPVYVADIVDRSVGRELGNAGVVGVACNLAALTVWHGGLYHAAARSASQGRPSGLASFRWQHPNWPCCLTRAYRHGAAIVARCFWDFGRWSDLWRAWRPLPASGTGFEDCMQRTRTQEASAAYAGCLLTPAKAAHA